MNISGCAVLVTGAKRIGAVVAVELASRGADVAVAYRHSREEAEQAAAEARGHGRQAIALQANLREPAACATLVQQAAAALGRLDVLVNMASVYRAAAFESLSEEDWAAPLEVDLRASYLCARAALPFMRAAGRGRIINISDWVARSGRPRYRGYLPYYVAKSAVIGLTEALALELAGDAILVNAIAPGPIVAPAGMDEEQLAEVERITPLGRWGGEGEIAKAVVALIESDFMTGETIRIDGGRHIR